MLVVVTSGGVKEKIDNVRSITNSSSGKLGMKIAREFLDNYENCEVIYIHGGVAQPCEGAENIYIRDTQNLLDVVFHILISRKVDIFVHCMAVADYTTSSVINLAKLKKIICMNNGNMTESLFDVIVDSCKIDTSAKMSSETETPAIVLEKTPKVINQIKKLSPYTFLVGFKLLDNVPEEELFDVGFNLLRKNRCNLVLANDIHNIRQGNHRGMLIYPEKTFDIIEGKDNIAKMIVAKSVERFCVKHPKSIQVSENNNISSDMYFEFFNAGQKFDKGSFLPKVMNHERNDKIGTYGNMSRRCGDKFYITCRNVNKGFLRESDMSLIDKVDIVDDSSVYSNVHYNSKVKPSIDTTIHSQIYKYTPYSHIVHIHTDKVFLGYPLVEKAYPCGCDLECNAIIDIIKKNPKTHIVQMKKHGLIILANSFDDCYDIVENLFYGEPCIDYSTHELSAECEFHIDDVEPSFDRFEYRYPIKINHTDVGCIVENIDDNIVHFGIYTMQNIRGKRLHIVEKYLSLYNKNYMLHTTVACDIADFYKNKYKFTNWDISNNNDLQYILRKNIL